MGARNLHLCQLLTDLGPLGCGRWHPVCVKRLNTAVATCSWGKDHVRDILHELHGGAAGNRD